MAELYILTSPNGKQYIGVTSKTAQWRFARHRSNALAGLTFCAALHCAMRKYGPENFSVKTLVVGDWNYVLGLEQMAISLYETMSPNGYNLREGGQFAAMSQETKDKISKLAKERHENDPEQGQKHSIRMLGRKHSPETIAKMIQTRGTKEWKAKARAAHLGKKFSEERKAKMRKAQQNREPISEESRQRMSEAAKKRGVPRSTINAMAKANRKKVFSVEERLEWSVRNKATWARIKARKEI